MTQPSVWACTHPVWACTSPKSRGRMVSPGHSSLLRVSSASCSRSPLALTENCHLRPSLHRSSRLKKHKSKTILQEPNKPNTGKHLTILEKKKIWPLAYTQRHTKLPLFVTLNNRTPLNLSGVQISQFSEWLTKSKGMFWKHFKSPDDEWREELVLLCSYLSLKWLDGA